jgi:hypothetical protein
MEDGPPPISYLLSSISHHTMSRWSAYGKLDSRLVEDGDNAFTGVDMTRDRALLQPGTLARSENKRLRIGAAATRLGNVQAPDFDVPFINRFIGSGIYSNPNGAEVMLVAELGSTYVWALQYGKDAFKVNLAAGQTLSGVTGVEFVQAFDKVLLLRRTGSTLTPLEWDGTAGHTFDPVAAPPGAFGVIPPVWNGEPFESRVLYYQAGNPALPWSYQFIMSDVLQYAGYDPALGTFNVNAGESDWITRLWPYFDQGVVVFKRRTIHLAQNFNIDPTLMTERALSKRLGLCATKCVLEWGPDLAFLSEPGGIYRLNQPLQNLIATDPLPISEPIQSVIDRINWSEAEKFACAAALGEYGYFAVPLDQTVSGNNAVLVLNLTNGQWESVPDRWSDPTFLIHALHVTQYAGGRALFGLDYNNRKIYALYQQEAFDQINGDILPISDLMETRGYTCGDHRAFKRYSRAVAALRTCDPLIQVSAIADGVNEVKPLNPSPLTKDRLKFYPHGHADFDPADGDPLEPKRQDYSLAGTLDTFVGEDYEVIPVGPVSEIPPTPLPSQGPRQETREPFSVRVNARWISLRIENLGGVCDVLSTGIEATQSTMETKTAA